MVLFRDAGDLPSLTEALHHLANATGELGDYVAAEAYRQEALESATATGDTFGQVWLLQGRGDDRLRAGDAAGAGTFYEQSASIGRANGHQMGAAWAIRRLGKLALSQGDRATARARFEEALVLVREIEHRPAIADLERDLLE